MEAIPLDSLRQVSSALRAAQDKKAQDPLVLDVRSLSGYTDFFLICHGNSAAQIKAITENIERKLRTDRIRPHHIEGDPSVHTWILMDYGDLIVHVFTPEARAHYGLESLWLDAPRIEIEEDSNHLGRAVEGTLRP